MTAVRYVALQDLVKVVREPLDNPREASRRLADKAREKLAEVEREQGKYPTVVKVDGRIGASEYEVSPDGTIIYLIHPFANFIDELITTLIQRSPVGPEKEGDGYRHYHYHEMWKILVNDVPEPFGSGRQPKPGETWTFVNVMPYSRRIYWGWSVQAPKLWIDRIAREFQKKYGNLFGGTNLRLGKEPGFEMDFIVPPGSIMPPKDHQFSKRAKRYNRHLRYPAIIVRIPGNALTT